MEPVTGRRAPTLTVLVPLPELPESPQPVSRKAETVRIHIKSKNRFINNSGENE
jgi:hypothetical protein